MRIKINSRLIELDIKRVSVRKLLQDLGLNEILALVIDTENGKILTPDVILDNSSSIEIRKLPFV